MSTCFDSSTRSNADSDWNIINQRILKQTINMRELFHQVGNICNKISERCQSSVGSNSFSTGHDER